MNDAPDRGHHRHWLLLVLLAGYWVALFVGTHLPPEFPGLPPQGYDKVVHFSAFAGLAGLLAVTWCYVWGRLHLWTAVVAWLVLLAYAAGDEITQPWFRRTCDIYDWRADACGAAVGLALVYGWQLLRIARGRQSRPTAQ
jgi:VanZ family protein